MSFYATISGQLTYDTAEDFARAVELLRNGGWVDEEGYFVDETGHRFENQQQPALDAEHRRITFPYMGFHRNLAYALNRLCAASQGRVVWTSDDGCFEGGVIDDGKEEVFDLVEWGKDHGYPDAEWPEDEEPGDDFFEMRADIEESFHLVYAEKPK